jgi:hypothetical protein
MSDEGSRLATAGVALALAGLSLGAFGPAYVNHDAAWYLHMVDRWFGGAALYRDVIDTNPPLIIWLTAPSVALARLTGWPATAVFKGFVLAAAMASILAVRAIVSRVWPHREFLLISLVVFLVLPFVKTDFGQREHLAVLLTMPYALLCAVPGEGMAPKSRAVAGVAAGIGFAIKPHFLLAWLAVECVVFACERTRAFRRPEFIGAVSACALYGAAVALFTPQYFVVADQVRRVYGGLNSPLSVLVRLREVQLWIVALGIFVAIRWRPSDRLPFSIFAFGTGYLAAALLQFKGWGYQLYPARVCVVLFLALAAATVLDEVPALGSLLRGGRRGLAVVFAALLLVASVRYVVEASRPATPDLVTPLIGAIAEHGGGRLTVLSMRTIIYPAFPAVNYSGASWGLRHNSLWFLPGFYADQDRLSGGPLEPHTLEQMSPLERLFFDQVAEDLCSSPPQLLAVERAGAVAPAGRRALDLLAYYAQNQSASRLLASYRLQGSLGPFTLYAPAAPLACR